MMREAGTAWAPLSSAETEELEAVSVQLSASISRLRVECPDSSWIRCYARARIALQAAEGRRHLEPVRTPVEPG